ncbi:MAG: outer membrane beta-barrel protein [Novosphingobium sp.]|nr:outer membrane beta-barrel protein [Novosphingobium sp.]
MKKLTLAAALAAATMLAAPAWAGSDEGKIQIKVLATGVLPDGKIDTINSAIPSVAAALGASPGTVANDVVVPTIAVEYYFSKNVSLETICCVTKHKVTGTGTIAGAPLIKDALFIPATFTLKYHMPLGAVKPYVGAGPSAFIMLDSKPDTTATALGVTNTKLSSNVGVAVQAGVDVAVGQGMGISLDAKKYWMNTTAKFYAGSTLALETKQKLDPWVVSGGIYFRF